MAYPAGPFAATAAAPPAASTPSPGELQVAVAGSDDLNQASLCLEDLTGFIRLTPLLSWNYSSLLNYDAYWYERATQTSVGSGTLARGNSFETISVAITDAASANIVGESLEVALWGATSRPGASVTHTHLINKVKGIGSGRTALSENWIDQQSAATSHHMGNFFTPTDLANAWREVQNTEFASLSALGTPRTVIRNNLDYFRVGSDPLLSATSATKYSNQNSELAKERTLASDTSLPKNASFAITFAIKQDSKAAGVANTPAGTGYFRVYWSDFCFQHNGKQASICLDTTPADRTKWVFEPILGLTVNPKGFTTVIFEVIGSSLVLTNADEVNAKTRQSPAWHHDFATEADVGQVLLTVRATKLTIGIRALDVAFSYIPVVYPPKGSLTVPVSSTGQSTENLRAGRVVETTPSMGGKVTLAILPGEDFTEGDFGYNVLLERGAAVDISPAVRSFELLSDPTYTGISIRQLSTTNRVRSVTANLGLESQSGSLLLDNRDSAFSDVGGVLPCVITAGWAGQTIVDPQTIFSGFITNQQAEKNTNHSAVGFTLIGADIAVKDALAINLPIYDGWDSGEAINDLLDRAGWQGERDVQTGGFQLAVAASVSPPLYKFSLGHPIIDCIREIATHAGYWAFVDALGVFRYREMSATYGDFLGTYREVPSVAAYDEWQSLTGLKDSTDSRNALLVMGLQWAEGELPTPVAAVRKDDGEGPIGFQLSNATIPWLRWQIIQDPKLNTQEAVERVAEQLWQNNARLRLQCSGAVWGHPKLLPWGKLAINLRQDNVGVPDAAQWRILVANHHLDAQTGNYTCTLEVEYADPRYSYASWWE